MPCSRMKSKTLSAVRGVEGDELHGLGPYIAWLGWLGSRPRWNIYKGPSPRP